jgi:hypothetical protein
MLAFGGKARRKKGHEKDPDLGVLKEILEKLDGMVWA